MEPEIVGFVFLIGTEDEPLLALNVPADPASFLRAERAALDLRIANEGWTRQMVLAKLEDGSSREIPAEVLDMLRYAAMSDEGTFPEDDLAVLDEIDFGEDLL